MNRSPRLPLPLLLFMAVIGPAVALYGTHLQAQQSEASRIVSVGGTVTEIIYALEQQDRLVARDTTSIYPPEAEALPDVGYMRALSPEGVLSVNPDLIIAVAGSGPTETIDVLAETAIPFVEIPDGYTALAVGAKIEAVGAALGTPEAATQLADTVRYAINQAANNAAQAAQTQTPRRVLFVLTTQGGRIMAAGTNTGADGIITLAGGTNAITTFEGYKQISDEAVILAAPDLILMMDRGGNHGADNDELFAMPAIAPTPAARSQSVVRMDGLLLLGFGPRTAQAITELSGALYGTP